MKMILLSSYGVVSLLLLLCGILFPDVMNGALIGILFCVIHCVFSMVILSKKDMADAGAMGICSWYGISALVCVVLSFLYPTDAGKICVLQAAVLTGFTGVATLAVGLMVKADPTTDAKRINLNKDRM
ncbi:MAG: hypothetical protein J5672_07640 [Verrucomicrobia bacterium]|nr:hypothetical protein [Verrucomicrobiota bacterium]